MVQFYVYLDLNTGLLPNRSWLNVRCGRHPLCSHKKSLTFVYDSQVRVPAMYFFSVYKILISKSILNRYPLIHLHFYLIHMYFQLKIMLFILLFKKFTLTCFIKYQLLFNKVHCDFVWIFKKDEPDVVFA